MNDEEWCAVGDAPKDICDHCVYARQIERERRIAELEQHLEQMTAERDSTREEARQAVERQMQAWIDSTLSIEACKSELRLLIQVRDALREALR